MAGQTEATVRASLGGLAAVAISAPRGHLEGWIADPELQSSIPGLRLSETHASQADLMLVFRWGTEATISFDPSAGAVLIEGPLDVFTADDFRHLVLHAFRTGVKLSGHHLVHAAAVVMPAGSGDPGRARQAGLLCGASGSGKSTLAAALALRGYSLAATDLAIVNRRLELVLGSADLSVYPGIIRRHLPALEPFIPRDFDSRDDWLLKTQIPGYWLAENGLLADLTVPPPLTHVFIVSARSRESHACCTALNAREKLEMSVVLTDEWLTTSWLSTSWRLPFPWLESDRTIACTEDFAVGLTRLPHYFVVGEINWVADRISELLGDVSA